MSERLRNAQRHERLKELLSQKVEKMLVGETGKRLNENQREFVLQEVDLLLHSGDVSEKALSRVVAQLRVLSPPTQPKKQSTAEKVSSSKKKKTKSEVSAVSSASAAAAAKRQLETSALSGSQPQYSVSPSRKEELSRVIAEDLWAKMAKKDIDELNKENARAKRISKQKAEEQRHFLDSQVALREHKKLAAIEEEKKFVVHEMHQLELWEDEEVKVEERRKKRFAEERRVRDEQLDLAKQRKLAEAAVLKEEDLEVARKLKEEYAKEQKVTEARRVKAREEVSKFQEYNAQFKDSRRNAHRKELEMDKEHQRLFLEKLAKQEQERENALLKMHERQKKQHIMATRIQDTIATKSAEDEDKALAYVAKIEEKKDEEARLKAEKEASEKVKLRQYLALQILAKEKEQDVKKGELEVEKRKAKEELEESERREAERRIAIKEKAMRHRREVESQIVEHQGRRVAVMTDTEKMLNSKRLQRL